MKTKTRISHLEDHIGYWMRTVSNAVSQNFSRNLEETGVTVAEWVVLREMFEKNETTSPSHVAEITGLTRGAVSKLVKRLLDKGLVARRGSSDDRRFQDIKLTPKAQNLIPHLANVADSNDDNFFSVLTKKEQIQILDLLKKLALQHQIKYAPID